MKIHNLLFFFNDLPLYRVPNLFSWQHVTLMIIAAAYSVLLSVVLKRCSPKTQDIVLKVLSVACAVVFAGRILWGYDSILEPAPIEGRTFQTLLPLELCNLGIFVIIAASFMKSQGVYNLSYFVTMVGGICAFICFPLSHTWPKSDILNYQFFDYYFIHNQLVAVPIALIACGRFKPSMKYIKFSLLAVLFTMTALLVVNLTLNALPLNIDANYMWVMHDAGIPLLKQLHELIPVPFIYELPLGLPVFFLFVALALPFTPKGQRMSEFKALFEFKPKDKNSLEEN